VDLIDEQHPWHNVCLALFSPFSNLGINLLPDFLPNLSCVSSKQSKEALHTNSLSLSKTILLLLLTLIYTDSPFVYAQKVAAHYTDSLVVQMPEGIQ